LQRVPGAFRSSEVKLEKLDGINRSWNTMLWMVLAFCNAVLTVIYEQKKQTQAYTRMPYFVFLASVSLHAILFQFLFLRSAFWFYFLTVIFLSIFLKT
jgi:hypothetical protein